MNINPLDLYIKCSRLVFNVEPSEVWENCDEFSGLFRKLYFSILCFGCRKLLVEPVNPKKNHLSCQHRVCLDCIGKKRQTTSNCKMCSDYTLFEKSEQTKIILRCFQELCELIHSSWIYDYMRKTDHDTGQELTPSFLEIIDEGMNYGNQVSIILDDTSSDENSNSSGDSGELMQSTSYLSQVSRHSPVLTSPSLVQSSPEQFTIISEPVIPMAAPVAVLPLVSAPPVGQAQQIVQYQPQMLQPHIPSTSRMTPNLQPAPTASFIKYPSPMRVTTIASVSHLGSKPIMTPMKVQSTFSSPTPTIYSVMYTGSGNKITLKRKPPDDTSNPVNASNNMTIIKTENSNFKRPPIQLSTMHQSLNPSPTPISSANVIITTPNAQTSPANPNDPQKRRGCRCGNATAAPGKLTCCGQRCPCYVDSKACIDCKCKGCRNPHYVDGHKKMRHQVPDVKTQQQQQQSFLASIQQQSTIVKDYPKSVMPSAIKQEDFGLIDPTMMAKTATSINNCIISMNSNGQYQIKPRIIMKDPVKTMSPLIFPTQTGMHQAIVTSANNAGIQIVGVYSQVPMIDKKIIIKNEPSSTTNVVSYADTTKQLLESTTALAGSNLNPNLL